MAKKHTSSSRKGRKPDWTHLGLTGSTTLFAGILIGTAITPSAAVEPVPVEVTVEVAEPTTQFAPAADNRLVLPDIVVDEPYPTFDFRDEHQDADPGRVSSESGNGRMVGGAS